MMKVKTGSRRFKLTAVFEKETNGYVSLCPELDIASQGDTLKEARANLREAVEGFFETASESEVRERLPLKILVEPMEVVVG
jgi:predicted RNase H-like HicB family nuclease